MSRGLGLTVRPDRVIIGTNGVASGFRAGPIRGPGAAEGW